MVAHALFLKILDNQPYIAPIEAPKNIVDLGTGTGLWSSLVADWFDGVDHPYAHVKGIDQAPQQDHSVQPNLEFEVDDITKDWTSSTLYDLVHIRLLWGVIDDWPKVFAESYKYASITTPHSTAKRIQTYEVWRLPPVHRHRMRSSVRRWHDARGYCFQKVGASCKRIQKSLTQALFQRARDQEGTGQRWLCRHSGKKIQATNRRLEQQPEVS